MLQFGLEVAEPTSKLETLPLERGRPLALGGQLLGEHLGELDSRTWTHLVGGRNPSLSVQVLVQVTRDTRGVHLVSDLDSR